MFKLSLSMYNRCLPEITDAAKRLRIPSRGNSVSRGLETQSVFREGAASGVAGFGERSLGAGGKEVSSVTASLAPCTSAHTDSIQTISKASWLEREDRLEGI